MKNDRTIVTQKSVAMQWLERVRHKTTMKNDNEISHQYLWHETRDETKSKHACIHFHITKYTSQPWWWLRCFFSFLKPSKTLISVFSFTWLAGFFGLEYENKYYHFGEKCIFAPFSWLRKWFTRISFRILNGNYEYWKCFRLFEM